MAATVCLGSGEYLASIVRRATLLGPAMHRGDLPGILSCSWDRAEQSTTDGAAVLPTAGLEGGQCAGVLSTCEPWRDELELVRAGDGVVWAGPVQNVIADPDAGTLTVTAKDLSAWFAKRAILVDLIHKGADLATIFEAYLAVGLAVDNPGIDVETSPTGILGDRTVAGADAKKLDGLLADLARTGVDWTVTARTFWVGGVELDGRTSTLPARLTDESFRRAPTTRRSGEGMANEWLTRGDKVLGRFGGPDPSDGVLLTEVQDASSIEDQRSADGSAASAWDRNHEAATYVEGDNELDPSAAVDVQTLIPGVLVPVDLSGAGAVPYLGTLRLEKVSATYDDGGETITVGLQPIGTTTGEAT